MISGSLITVGRRDRGGGGSPIDGERGIDGKGEQFPTTLFGEIGGRRELRRGEEGPEPGVDGDRGVPLEVLEARSII